MPGAETGNKTVKCWCLCDIFGPFRALKFWALRISSKNLSFYKVLISLLDAEYDREEPNENPKFESSQQRET
ncbi:unnamed protein product [Rotaria sordida]|uniref:Uncharacterized protein n=1 Tax=Rotaria sordida TaxID=392033 RepID=A0A814DFI3_9BILA|nr:unnamed protein product [Rotaria sordida]CAF0954706.1 unnamed protein product [Rotaria sordida]